MMLRRIFEPKRDEVTGEWRKLQREELNDLYSSRNIIRVVKSRKISWEKGEMHTVFQWGNLRERNNLEDPDVDGRIILR
jgi:hypothetical protein